VRKIFPAVAAGVTVLAVAGGTFAFSVADKGVQVSVDGATSEVRTMASTVGQVLDSQGIDVGPHDVVAPAPQTTVTEGTRIAVQFGRPVTISVDGKPQTFWTTATTVDKALQARRIDVAGGTLSTSRSASIGRDGLAFALSTSKTVTIDNAGKQQKLTTTAQTVGAALAAAKIVADADDVLNVAAGKPLVDGAKISYTRVDTAKVTKKATVEHETTYRDTKKLDKGKTKVKTKGADGVRTIVYTETRRNGKLESRKKSGSTVTKKPRTEVVLRGTKAVKSVLDGGEPADVGNGGGQKSNVFVTGYTYWDNSPPGSAQIARPIIHDRAGGTGTWKDPITVAVGFGPRFKFGTRFYLPEMKKYFIVEDLCGACSDGRNGGEYTLDIWLDGSHLSSGGATACAAKVTGLAPAIKDPDSDLPVDSGSVC
jgi:uncharacterized protein YabE (DUF348 family)